MLCFADGLARIFCRRFASLAAPFNLKLLALDDAATHTRRISLPLRIAMACRDAVPCPTFEGQDGAKVLQQILEPFIVCCDVRCSSQGLE